MSILFVDNLVQIQLSEVNEMATANLFRFYGLVKVLLPREQAASSLGLITRLGGATFGDAFIDYEVEMALNMIKQSERSRQSALLILSELAKNSPGNFYRHVELVLEQIWVPLGDMRVSSEFRYPGHVPSPQRANHFAPQLEVKHAAAELVAVCLHILFARDTQISYPIAERLLNVTLDSLRATNSATLVAGMFVYKELLKRGGMVSCIL